MLNANFRSSKSAFSWGLVQTSSLLLLITTVTAVQETVTVDVSLASRLYKDKSKMFIPYDTVRILNCIQNIWLRGKTQSRYIVDGIRVNINDALKLYSAERDKVVEKTKFTCVFPSLLLQSVFHVLLIFRMRVISWCDLTISCSLKCDKMLATRTKENVMIIFGAKFGLFNSQYTVQNALAHHWICFSSYSYM